jgi:hypothetical protein
VKLPPLLPNFNVGISNKSKWDNSGHTYITDPRLIRSEVLFILYLWVWYFLASRAILSTERQRCCYIAWLNPFIIYVLRESSRVNRIWGTIRGVIVITLNQPIYHNVLVLSIGKACRCNVPLEVGQCLSKETITRNTTTLPTLTGPTF